jgi:asparagine synthase (glutamine-hydrolysing)
VANFLIVIDPDLDRSAAFRKVASREIAFLDNLTLGQCSCREFHALWASGPRAPVTSVSDEQAAAVIWGRPIADGDGRQIEARELASAWSGAKDAPPPIFDGYYAAASYHAQNGLVVGADILGMFPVFWWSSGDVLLVASSPELFKHHPLFRFELDLAGLTGILLMMHSVDGRTLTEGVNRLGAGKALLWRKGSAPRDVLQYELPVSTEHFSLPFSHAVELVNDTLRRSVARHVPSGEKYGLTLSGGRDSRLLAGTLIDLERKPVAMTFGDRDDIEMQCATGVAKALRLEHHTPAMRLEGYDLLAELHAKWLHCCTGFNCIEYWSWLEDLQTLPPFFSIAFIMDYVLGGSHFDWGYSGKTKEMSFANYFARVNAYGIPVRQLRLLLKSEIFGGLVDDVVGRLKNTYDGYSDIEAQRIWCFGLHHRIRFYTATLPWQFSFASWPIMPIVDKEVFKVTSGIPAGVLSERLVEDEIIRRHFPVLAELPVDRNNYDTTPINPRLRWRIEDNLLARIAPLTRRFFGARHHGPDRRIYYRVFDFNGPAWRMARRQAEPHRHRLYGLFDKQVFDSILPPPDADVKVPDGIIDFSGKKLLVGLLLWAGKYL